MRPPPVLRPAFHHWFLSRRRWGRSPSLLKPDSSGRGGTCGSECRPSDRIPRACLDPPNSPRRVPDGFLNIPRFRFAHLLRLLLALEHREGHGLRQFRYDVEHLAGQVLGFQVLENAGCFLLQYASAFGYHFRPPPADNFRGHNVWLTSCSTPTIHALHNIYNFRELNGNNLFIQ